MSAADVLAGRAQWAIEQGDVLDRLAALPDESVNCVVTSPPYWGLRDYGLPPSVWGGDPACVHEWGEGLRVHKGGPHGNGVLLDGGRGVIAAQEAVKNYSAGAFCLRCEAWLGCLGLEPTPSLFVQHVAAVFAGVRRVLRSDGVAWVNLGDSYANDGKWGGYSGGRHPRGLHGRTGIGRAKRQTGLKPKDLVGIPWRVAFALQADGWWLRSDVIWAKPNPMPESVTDRPTRSHEYLFLLTKSARYWYDADAIREPAAESTLERWGDKTYARVIPDGYNRDGEQRLTPASWSGERNLGTNPAGRNKRSVWTIATEPYPDAHFATFPTALVEPCILAGCPVGGVVLDPFAGSGTVVLEALRHGRRGIGIDFNPAYVAMARRRVEGDCPMFNAEASG